MCENRYLSARLRTGDVLEMLMQTLTFCLAVLLVAAWATLPLRVRICLCKASRHAHSKLRSLAPIRNVDKERCCAKRTDLGHWVQVNQYRCYWAYIFFWWVVELKPRLWMFGQRYWIVDCASGKEDARACDRFGSITHEYVGSEAIVHVIPAFDSLKYCSQLVNMADHAL